MEIKIEILHHRTVALILCRNEIDAVLAWNLQLDL
jgi:hypothetical protein